MRKGRSPAARTPKKPADAVAGARHVRKFMLRLFDRENGKTADWPLIAETLLREAFYALDQSPDEHPRGVALLQRVSAGAYDRLTADPAASKTPAPAGRNEAGNADLHSSGPGAVDAFRSTI